MIAGDATAMGFGQHRHTGIAVVGFHEDRQRHYNREISRWEGGLLTVYYLMYVIYRVLSATGYDGLWLLNRWLIWIGLPITVFLLAFTVARSVAGRRGGEVAS